MEKENSNERFARFYLDLYGKKVECTPENTEAYLYEDEKFDHIFYCLEETDEYKAGYKIWREMLGSERFDLIVRYMIDAGFSVENLDEIEEADLASYYESYPDEIELPTYEIGPSLEKKIANWGLYLQYIDVTVEDFNV